MKPKTGPEKLSQRIKEGMRDIKIDPDARPGRRPRGAQSAAWLAGELGIETGNFSRWKNGELDEGDFVKSVEVLAHMADKFNVEFEWLLTGRGAKRIDERLNEDVDAIVKRRTDELRAEVTASLKEMKDDQERREAVLQHVLAQPTPQRPTPPPPSSSRLPGRTKRNGVKHR